MNRPLQHLVDISRDYPDLWHLVDQLRPTCGSGLLRWADWCFLPLAGAYAIVSGGADDRVPFHRSGEIARIGALAAWRPTQGIYRFDPTFMDAIWTTPLRGGLPVELFFRLPEWCVYIETEGRPVLDGSLHGFFCHLEDEPREPGHYELRLLLDTDESLHPVPIHLAYGSTIERGLADTLEEGKRNAARGLLPADISLQSVRLEGFSEVISPLVSLVLYLCSDSPDLQALGGPDRPGRSRPQKTKQGWRIFPPDKPRVWNVGDNLGALLRAAYERERDRDGHETADLGGTHASPRPHKRRAHWHFLWTGPKREPARRLILKWLYPMP
jgi:hypothetical protein